MEKMNGKPVAQSHRSYEMEVTSPIENISSSEPVNITYKIKNDLRNTLSKFEVAHEKIMHFIAIRKDLQHFQHLHPDYDPETNEFSINLALPEDGAYRLFADFVPGDDNPMKLPVAVYTDISSDDNFTEIPLDIDQSNTKTAEGYSITYLFPDEMKLKKEEEVAYSLVIEKDGQPVTDLENYLGAKGHSVIIKESTLNYIHTHAVEDTTTGQEGHSMGHQAMQMEASDDGNKVNFSTSFPEAGIYKIFTQFQHSGKVITTDYVLKVN
jgi:P-type Cu+ transporter